MTKHRLLTLSDRWFRLLLRCYPRDFRDEMGDAVVQVYSDRAVDLWRLRGPLGLLCEGLDPRDGIKV